MPLFTMDVTFEADSEEEAGNIQAAIRHVLKEHDVEVMISQPHLDDMATQPTINTIHTDGGCDLKKNGLGAWSYVMHKTDGTVLEDFGSEMGTTNNRMEMMGVIKGLEEVPIGSPVRVVSDSQYVIKGSTEWLYAWKANGWLTSDQKPVKNKDLWERIFDLIQIHSEIVFIHVKGHRGHTYNERCDVLCSNAMEAQWKVYQGSE